MTELLAGGFSATESTLVILGFGGLVALLVSSLTVELVRRRLGDELLDVPNERSSHETPTPRGGGLGIVAGTVSGSVAVWMLGVPVGGHGHSAFAMSLGLVVAVSLLDDWRSLPARIRFLIHFAAASFLLVAIGGGPPIELPLVGAITGPFRTVLWLLWMVGLTNAYNFMDGIDGIAGLQGLVSALAWATLAFLAQAPALLAVSLCAAAATVAFLRQNWAPARIFMGDAGSTAFGFSLAAAPLLVGELPEVATIGFLVVVPFVGDAAFTFFRRAVAREDVFAAHRTHLYQRLVQAGMSHAAVSLRYGRLALGTAGLALLVAQETITSGTALGLAGVVALGHWFFVRDQEGRSSR